jgi:hypothetical protein
MVLNIFGTAVKILENNKGKRDYKYNLQQSKKTPGEISP